MLVAAILGIGLFCGWCFSRGCRAAGAAQHLPRRRGAGRALLHLFPHRRGDRQPAADPRAAFRRRPPAGGAKPDRPGRHRGLPFRLPAVPRSGARRQGGRGAARSRLGGEAAARAVAAAGRRRLVGFRGGRPGGDRPGAARGPGGGRRLRPRKGRAAVEPRGPGALFRTRSAATARAPPRRCTAARSSPWAPPAFCGRSKPRPASCCGRARRPRKTAASRRNGATPARRSWSATRWWCRSAAPAAIRWPPTTARAAHRNGRAATTAPASPLPCWPSWPAASRS